MSNKDESSKLALDSQRLQLGRDAIVSEALAVQLLPCRDAVARKWLRDNHLVSEVLGGSRAVHWQSVVDTFNRQSRPKQKIRFPVGDLARVKLN